MWTCVSLFRVQNLDKCRNACNLKKNKNNKRQILTLPDRIFLPNILKKKTCSKLTNLLHKKHKINKWKNAGPPLAVTDNTGTLTKKLTFINLIKPWNWFHSTVFFSLIMIVAKPGASRRPLHTCLNTHWFLNYVLLFYTCQQLPSPIGKTASP